MYTFESVTTLTKNISDVCTNLLTIVITASIVLFIIYLRYVFCREDEKWNKEKIQHLKSTPKKEYTWQCLLIDGVWGSGKTTHYEKYYQYIDDKPNIYISCFSASRSELIAQIIQQQFWRKLLTLNGLLAKLMESNWQIFMPKNLVVVFDDLERLHANQDNYLDLIGIIDYLKDKKICKIILICNVSELKEPIFNTYMERIVDETQFPILISENEFSNILIKETNDLTKQLLNILYQYYADGKINNLRIIKNIMPKISDQLDRDYSEFNEVEQVVNGSQHEIIKLINKHYLFYIDNVLFKDCSEYSNNKVQYSSDDDKSQQQVNLQQGLNLFNLKLDDFKCQEYKTWRDNDKTLEPDLGNFLKGDIELLISQNKYEDAKVRINEYLEKFVTEESNNNFDVIKKTNSLQNDSKEYDNTKVFILLLCYLIWYEDESEQIIDKVALNYINKFGVFSVCNINLKIAFIGSGEYFRAFDQESYFNDNFFNRSYANGHSGRVLKNNDPKLDKFKKIFQNILVKFMLENIRSINNTCELPFVSFSSNGNIYIYEELWDYCNSSNDQIIYKKSCQEIEQKNQLVDDNKRHLIYKVEKIIEIIYCYCNNQVFNNILNCEDQNIIKIYHADFISKLNENQVEDLQLSEYINNDLLIVLKQRLSDYLTRIMKHFECDSLNDLLDIKNKATKELFKNLLENENIK